MCKRSHLFLSEDIKCRECSYIKESIKLVELVVDVIRDEFIIIIIIIIMD